MKNKEKNQAHEELPFGQHILDFVHQTYMDFGELSNLMPLATPPIFQSLVMPLPLSWSNYAALKLELY